MPKETPTTAKPATPTRIDPACDRSVAAGRAVTTIQTCPGRRRANHRRTSGQGTLTPEVAPTGRVQESWSGASLGPLADSMLGSGEACYRKGSDDEGDSGVGPGCGHGGHDA